MIIIIVQQERRQRMKRKTARVFFSSPFGGLEEEREELTKKYWPRLESMCNKAGYDFIPVDLRWGITSEMSSSAVTIKVCLNEMDRSDMIVGFFGQVSDGFLLAFRQRFIFHFSRLRAMKRM